MRKFAGIPAGLLCLPLLVACQANSPNPSAAIAELSSAPSQSSVADNPDPLTVAQRSFPQWLNAYGEQAIAQGISAATVNRAFQGVELNGRVLELDSRQPEFTRPIWDYLATAASAQRISRGRQLLAQHRSLLDEVGRAYGVDPQYIVAIWGLESDYGRTFGDFNVVEVLATLGYQGRRQDYGREQLIAALRILERGDIEPARMQGSWAGAMGHTQFIPTSFLAYAVDYDGDNRRDIWGSLADVFASTANYLNKANWQNGQPWGVEVVLPPDFDWDLVDPDTRKPVREWALHGIRPARGSLPASDAQASLIAPAGYRGPAFLVLQNFRTILRYNNATSYALAVAHLGDRITGGESFVADWPTDLQPLSRSDKLELQRLLNRLGYNVGGVDGIIGPRTRSAVKRFQKSIGVPNDGYPTQELLTQLRRQVG